MSSCVHKLGVLIIKSGSRQAESKWKGSSGMGTWYCFFRTVYKGKGD